MSLGRLNGSVETVALNRTHVSVNIPEEQIFHVNGRVEERKTQAAVDDAVQDYEVSIMVFCEFYVARSTCEYRTLQSAPHAVVPPVLSNGQLIGYDRFDPIGAALRAGSCRRGHGVFPATSRGSGSVAMSLMQVISFKDTVLYKRGFWLSAAALVAAVAAPSVVDKSIFDQPVVHVIPILILVGFGVYFLQKGRFFSIADEVIDCGDHLNVRRAGTEIEIPFSSISAAEVSTAYRMHRITVHLREETKIGKRVDFWPQASLWGNLFAVQQVAIGLADRAKRAIGSDV